MKPSQSVPIILITAACSAIHPVTLARLALMNPLAMDPEHVVVAVSAPDTIGVQRDSAILTIFGRQTPDSDEVRSEFVLEQIKDGTTNRFRVAASDLPALRTAQARHAAWEAADARASSGGISVFVAPCFRGRALPFEDLQGTMSVAIQVTDTGGMMPLLRDVPLQDIAAQVIDANDDLRTLPLCNTGD